MIETNVMGVLVKHVQSSFSIMIKELEYFSIFINNGTVHVELLSLNTTA